MPSSDVDDTGLFISFRGLRYRRMNFSLTVEGPLLTYTRVAPNITQAITLGHCSVFCFKLRFESVREHQILEKNYVGFEEDN